MTTAQTVFSRSDIIPDFMPTVSLFTMAINSLVNPVIYAFFKPDFIIPIRIFLRSLFRGQCCRKQNLVGIEMNTFNPLTLSFRINLKNSPIILSFYFKQLCHPTFRSCHEKVVIA